jgi:pyridoxal phosphate enzyme (YggS family)
MMSSPDSAYGQLKSDIEQVHSQNAIACNGPTLIAVSKRQPLQRVQQVLAAGHQHFGENQLQEAKARWEPLKKTHPDVTLHLIGPLQSNKVHDAVALFDVIHTVDREKIARAIKEACDKQGKLIPCLIQVNIGEEPQKAGITPAELPDFLALCRDEIGLSIIGLMAIPPADENPAPHFALLQKLANRHGLAELSMGMSGDWRTAMRFGATYLRLGTAVFGARES